MLLIALLGLNEVHQNILVVDHEHLLHVYKSQTLIAHFGRSGNLKSDGVHELLNEEVVFSSGDILLTCQDFLV